MESINGILVEFLTRSRPVSSPPSLSPPCKVNFCLLYRVTTIPPPPSRRRRRRRRARRHRNRSARHAAAAAIESPSAAAAAPPHSPLCSPAEGFPLRAPPSLPPVHTAQSVNTCRRSQASASKLSKERNVLLQLVQRQTEFCTQVSTIAETLKGTRQGFAVS